MADLTQTGAEVQALLDKVETLNVGIVDANNKVEEPIPPYKEYVDGVVGDINAILDNINGEVI